MNNNKVYIESLQDYYLVKHLKEFSDRTLFGIVLREEQADYLDDHPELARKFAKIKASIESTKWAIKEDFKKVADIEDPKDFSFRVAHLTHAPVLYAMHKGQIIDDYFLKANVDFIMNLVEKI